MQSKDATEHFKHADALYRAGQFNDALLILNQLNEQFPDNKNVLYPRALCLAQLGRVDEADRICKHLEAYFQDKRCPELRALIKSRREHGTQSAADEAAAQLAAMNLDALDTDTNRLNELDLNETVVPPPPPIMSDSSGTPVLKYGLIAIAVVALGAVVLVPLFMWNGSASPTGEPLSQEELAARAETILTIIFLPLGLVTLPFPLYFTLKLREQLPYDDFWPDYKNTWGYSFVATLISLIPCIGFIIALYFLHKTYDLGGVGVAILVGLSLLLTAVLLVAQFAVGFALGLGAAVPGIV